MHRQYYTINQTCQENNSQTSNSKFLPLNDSVYNNNCAYMTPINIQSKIYNKYKDHYPKSYPEDVNADITPHSYNFYNKSDKGLIPEYNYIDNKNYRHITNNNSEPILRKEIIQGSCNLKNSSCTTDTCGKNPYLDPVMDPKYNLREVVKQLILLEDHLSHIKKRCQDCIRKHFLFIEGLIEEAITLDKHNECRDITNKALNKFKNVEKIYFREYTSKKPTDDNFYCGIAQQLREIRKPIMNNKEICSIGCK